MENFNKCRMSVMAYSVFEMFHTLSRAVVSWDVKGRSGWRGFRSLPLLSSFILLLKA